MATRRADLQKIRLPSMLKDKKRMLWAMEKQDRLAKKAGNWHSTKVIRKWREKSGMS